jgi:peroxiredoxin
MPEMQRLYEQHKARGLEIVGIDVQESPEGVKGFAKELGLTFPIVLDRDGSVVDRYFVSGLPSHFFVDRDGIIQAIHIGGLETAGGRRAPVEEYLEKILDP